MPIRFVEQAAGLGLLTLILLDIIHPGRRNTVALDIDTWSGQTGDAVELLARLFPEGQTSAGCNVMVQWASAMASVKEMHHFHPVLWYFRFTDARYSMTRTALITLEAAALTRTARCTPVPVGARFSRARAGSKDRPAAARHEARVAEYVRLRAGWDARLVALAHCLGDTPQIDVSTERNR